MTDFYVTAIGVCCTRFGKPSERKQTRSSILKHYSYFRGETLYE